MGDTVTIPGRPAAVRGELAAGDLVDRYVLIERLGAGGMGVVWAANDPELDRKVAIKLVHRAIVHERAQERLLREAQAMAKLSHPAVVPVFDVGRTDGQWFVAMELVDGTTLRAALREQNRPWQDVLAMFLRAGRGLAAAHDAGIIHRDFKPENVLVGRDGAVRVTDFGLASFGLATADEQVPDVVDGTLTHTGAVMGTPKYMAPEQHSGAEVTPASDQFSFSVALWEALYRQAPFAVVGEEETSDSYSARVLAGELQEPSTGARKNVPAWVREIITRGLSVVPGTRWPSMSAMLDAFEAAQRRRRRLAIGIAAGAATLVIAGGTVAAMTMRESTAGAQCEDMDRALAGVWDNERETVVRAAFAKTGASSAADTATRVVNALDAYTAAWVDARRTECEATNIHGDQSRELLDRKVACFDRQLLAVRVLVDRFADAAKSDVVDRALGAVFRLPPLALCSDPEALQPVEVLPSDPAKRAEIGSIRVQLASLKAFSDTGQYKVGHTLANKLAEQAIALGYPPLVAESLYHRGHMERLEGQAPATLVTFDAALLAAAEAHDDRLFVELVSDKMTVLADQMQRPDEALALRPVAEAALRRAGSDRVTAGNLYANIGRMLTTANHLAEAELMFEKAIAIKEQVSGRDSFDVARALTGLGNAFMAQEKYDDALATYERAAAIWRAKFGPDNPDVLGIEGNIANVRFQNGAYERARVDYETNLASLARVLGPDHPRVGDLEGNLANTLVKLQRYDEAIVHYHRSIDIKTKAFGETNADIAETHYGLGQLDLEIGRHADARAEYTKSIAMYEAIEQGTSDNISFPLTGLAETLIALHRAGEALPHAERALAIREKSEIGEGKIAYTRMIIGHALLELGRDPVRGRKLVMDARTFFAENGEDGPKFVAKADKILAQYK